MNYLEKLIADVEALLDTSFARIPSQEPDMIAVHAESQADQLQRKWEDCPAMGLPMRDLMSLHYRFRFAIQRVRSLIDDLKRLVTLTPEIRECLERNNHDQAADLYRRLCWPSELPTPPLVRDLLDRFPKLNLTQHPGDDRNSTVVTPDRGHGGR